MIPVRDAKLAADNILEQNHIRLETHLTPICHNILGQAGTGPPATPRRYTADCRFRAVRKHDHPRPRGPFIAILTLESPNAIPVRYLYPDQPKHRSLKGYRLDPNILLLDSTN
ncbi:MAG: hypothetical protein ACLGH3_10570 [Actinomycetota bacterium]